MYIVLLLFDSFYRECIGWGDGGGLVQHQITFPNPVFVFLINKNI